MKPSPLRAVVVDDEPLGRERVVDLLSSRGDVTVVAEACDGREAVDLVRRERPDLLLLDVQMPELDGLGVLEQLALDERPAVVFVTAYERFAVQAFDLHALDYVLKPFDDARFHEAVDRAVSRHAAGDREDFSRRLLHLLRTAAPGAAADHEIAAAGSGRREPISRIAVRLGANWHIVEANDVDWIEGAGVYARLVVGEKTYLLRTSLSELESRLHPDRFARIHRSTIVNLDRVREVRPHGHGEFVLVLNDDMRLKVSRSYGERIRAFLDRLG